MFNFIKKLSRPNNPSNPEKSKENLDSNQNLEIQGPENPSVEEILTDTSSQLESLISSEEQNEVPELSNDIDFYDAEFISDFKEFRRELLKVFDIKILNRSVGSLPIFQEFIDLGTDLKTSLRRLCFVRSPIDRKEQAYKELFPDLKKISSTFQGFLFIQNVSIPAEYSRQKTNFDRKIVEIFSFMGKDLKSFINKYYPGLQLPIINDNNIDIENLDQEGVSDLSSTLVKLDESNLEISFRYINEMIDQIESTLVTNEYSNVRMQTKKVLDPIRESINNNRIPNKDGLDSLFYLLKGNNNSVREYLSYGRRMSPESDENLNTNLETLSMLITVIDNLNKLKR